jgi:hypothetical protein
MVDSSNDSLFYYYNKDKYTRNVISINSSDRIDYDNTNSNDYTVYLKNPLTQIVAIKLISTIIPNTQYVINSTNNKIDFTDTGYPIVSPAPISINNTALGGALNQVSLAAIDSKPVNNYYNNYIIKITSGPALGDVRVITAYATIGNIVTVAPNFTVAVGVGDTYSIFPMPFIENH